MILADKIIELRKKEGLSQEELADKLGVSRQSVSKWEMAQSTPDLNRILKMSELFGVSTDYLLKEDADLSKPASAEDMPFAAEQAETVPPLTHVSLKEANDFLHSNRRHAFLVALGVALCVVSVTPPLCLDLFSPAIANLSVVFLFLFIAAAVGLFIFSGISMKRFDYLSENCIDTEYGIDGMVKEKKKRYQPRHTIMLIAGVMLCILSVVPPIVCSSLVSSAFTDRLGAVLLFVLIAAGVFLLVNTGIIMSGFHILLEEEGFSREEKQNAARMKPVSAAYWLIITALYLGYSFITWSWERSWIIWPVAAVCFPVVILIAKAIRKKAA